MSRITVRTLLIVLLPVVAVMNISCARTAFKPYATVIVDERFKDNERGWRVTDPEGGEYLSNLEIVGMDVGFIATLADGQYSIDHKRRGSSYFRILLPHEFDPDRDFTITARLKEITRDEGGDLIGLVWGGAGFFFSGDRHYAYAKLKKAGGLQWKQTKYSTKTRGERVLGVRKAGGAVMFFVDGDPVDSAPFEGFSERRVGFAVGGVRKVSVNGLVITQPPLSKREVAEKKQGRQATIHYKKGRELASTGKFPKAIEEFDKAIGLNPELDVAYVSKGIALGAMGKHALAIREFDQAMMVTSRTKLWWPKMHKGIALGSLQKLDDAIKELSDSLELTPTAEAYGWRAVAYKAKFDRDASPQHLRDARSDIDAAIKEEPKLAVYWATKASILLRTEGVQPANDTCVAINRACALGDCRLLDEFSECGTTAY